MDKPPQGNNIIFLAEKRKGRDAQKKFEMPAELEDIEPGIDIRGEAEVGITVGLMSAADIKKDSLGIVLYRVVDGELDTLGALWLTRAQWQGLKKTTDRSLKSAAKSRAKHDKKTPSRP